MFKIEEMIMIKEIQFWRKTVLFLLVCVVVQFVRGAEIPNKNKLWFLHPANDWYEAMPLGNGRIVLWSMAVFFKSEYA